MTAGLNIAAVLVCGLLAIERRAFLQAAVSRPLVAGTAVGLVWGEPAIGLAMGAALELFFLGTVNLGAALSENDLFATVAATGCACALADGGRLPPEAALALGALLTLPAAKLGYPADILFERLNSTRAAHLEALRAGRLRNNLYGLWVPFAFAAAVALAGHALGSLLEPVVAQGPSSLPRALSIAWVALLVACGAVALRTVQTTRAFALGAVAASAVAAGELIVVVARVANP